MINRSLSKRLQKLEARLRRLRPTKQPRVLQVRYVSPDGSVRDGPLFPIGNFRPPATRSARATQDGWNP